MLNRNPKRLSAEVFSSAQKQPKQNTSSQTREENGSTTLRSTREKPLLAGYLKCCTIGVGFKLMKAKPTKPHFRNPADGQLRLKTLRAKTICRLSPLNLHIFLNDLP